MVMGHYATALIPYAYESNRKLAPFWFFLLATQMLDFIMIALVFIGVESVEPSNFFEASFRHMVVDMTYSHDILPVIVWSILFAIITLCVFRSLAFAFIVFGLTVLHELMDLLVGFKHFWFGIPQDASGTVYGLGLYNTAPVLGIIIEIGICAGILAWYFHKRAALDAPVARRSKIILCSVLLGFTTFLIVIANQSLTDLLFA